MIRAIITNDVTNQPSNALIDDAGRTALEHQILHDITTADRRQDHRRLFTDVAVQ